MFYQVTIDHKAPKARGIHALNLSRELLEHRVLGPYRQGNPITLSGTTIPCSEISRIRIVATAEQFDRNAGLSDMTLLQLTGFTYSDSERDVTDDLITGPPGWELRVDTPHTHERQPAAGVREVFVVHGRNLTARDEVFNFLRAIDLHPLEWSVAVQATGKPSPYIGEILDAAFSRAHAIVVLFTPDDEARLREPLRSGHELPHETQLTGQARPNVLFESGMAMARSQDRTILVELGTLRPFSDIAGLHVVRMDGSSKRRQDLAKRLERAGCPVNLEGTDWHTAGDFAAAMLLPVQESPSATVQQPTIPEALQLSEEARELLVEAAADRGAVILVSRTFGGTVVQANGRRFAERGNRRSAARWEQAIRDLLSHELIWDPSGKGEILELTQQGFQIADGLGTS